MFGCLILETRYWALAFGFVFRDSIDGASVHLREVVKTVLTRHGLVVARSSHAASSVRHHGAHAISNLDRPGAACGKSGLHSSQRSATAVHMAKKNESTPYKILAATVTYWRNHSGFSDSDGIPGTGVPSYQVQNLAGIGIGSFPKYAPFIRLVGALLLAQNDD